MEKTIDSSLTQVITLLAELTVFNQLDFEQFLKQLIVIIQKIIPTDSCLIYFYDKQHKHLLLIGSKNPQTNTINTLSMEEGEGITGWVAKYKQTVVIEKKAYQDPRFKAFAQLPEDTFESFLSVPIVNETGVVGVINVQNKKPHSFDVSQVKTIESLVKIISSAFAKVILERKVSTLENQLEERKVVEKAKGILMRLRNMTEEQAFAFIRGEAMNRRKSMKDIADAILLVWQ